MTAFQIISLVALAVALLAQLPRPSFARKVNTMAQIEQVIAIRDSSSNPEVVAACKALLQTLLL